MRAEPDHCWGMLLTKAKQEKTPNRPAAYINMKPYKIGDLASM